MATSKSPPRTPAKRAPARKAPRRPVPAKRPASPGSARPVPSKRPASPRAHPAPREAAPAPLTLPFEIDPKAVEASLKTLREQVVVWAKKGRYTKVRFKFRGKAVLPDIPLAAVAAVEGATFYWTGLLRLLVVNVAGRALIDVELVNDSEKKLQAGKEALLSGDLEQALVAFREAVDMDHGNPQVHLNLGIALKLQGQSAAARAALEQAAALDPDGPAATEARRLLDTLPAPAPALPAASTGP